MKLVTNSMNMESFLTPY